MQSNLQWRWFRKLMGSYLWLSNIDNEEDFYKENHKLLTEISYFDVCVLIEVYQIMV